ncbi:hypothetical protein JCM10450v2_003252 [Rhodotorula kratochvilovae]
MLDRLPDELLVTVLDSLAAPAYAPRAYEARQGTLRALCLTSRRLHRLAQPVLFRHVYVHERTRLDQVRDVDDEALRAHTKVYQFELDRSRALEGDKYTPLAAVAAGLRYPNVEEVRVEAVCHALDLRVLGNYSRLRRLFLNGLDLDDPAAVHLPCVDQLRLEDLCVEPAFLERWLDPEFLPSVKAIYLSDLCHDDDETPFFPQLSLGFRAQVDFRRRRSAASVSLPDELLASIFRLLVPAKYEDYRALYPLCLASRRFRTIAQSFLWEVISIEVLPSPADVFVEAARTFGQHTRHFELTAAREVEGKKADLAAYLPAVREMRELRVLQLGGVMVTRSLNLDKVDCPYLEHLGLVGLRGASFSPSLADNLVSLDTTASSHNLKLVLERAHRKMRNLRALAIDAAHASDLPDHLLPQLDMLQLYAQSAEKRAQLAHAPHKTVPLLLSLPISNHHEIQFPTFPFHLQMDAVTLDDVNRGHGAGDVYLEAYLARLTELVKEGGIVQSLWLPRDLEEAGSPTSTDAQNAWAALCDSAKTAAVPGRLVGGAEEPSPLVGGRLSWAFWEHAKALRARGET